MKLMVNHSMGEIGGIINEVNLFKEEIKKNPRDSLVVLIPSNTSLERLVEKKGQITFYTLPKPNINENASLSEFYNSNKGYVSNIKRIINKENPDGVLALGTFYLPWFLVHAAKELDKKVIVRFCGIINKESTKKLWLDMGKSFLDQDCDFVFPSIHARDTVSEIYMKDFNCSQVIYHKVMDRFNSKGLIKSRYERFNIGMVGRFDGIKNFEFAKVIGSRFNLNNGCRLTLVTDKDPLSRELDSYRELGIEFMKPMQSPQLAEFYRNSDLIISPSNFETYGYVPLEAICCGTPTLVSNNMGIKEIFKKVKLDDLILDFKDFDAVFSKIERIKEKGYSIPGGIVDKLGKESISWGTFNLYKELFQK